MIKITVGKYKKTDNRNKVGILIKTTSINSPILTNIKKVNLLSSSSNVLNNIFLYPSKVQVEGIYFSETLSRTVLEKEYFYDQINQQLIFLYSPKSLVIEYHQNPIIATDCQPLLGYPVLSATLARTWLEQPSGAISLAVSLDGLEGHIDRLRPGTEFDWLGVGFRIASFSVTHTSKLIQYNLLKIDLQLEGKWSGYLKPSQYTDNKNLKITTLQQIAERNGAILEFSTWPIVIPKNGYSQSFDWVNLLDGISKLKQQYIYWSDSNAIKLKNIETKPSKIIINPIGDIKINHNYSYEHHNKINNAKLLKIKEGAENYIDNIRKFNKIYYPYTEKDYSFVIDNQQITSNIFLYSDGRLQNEYLQYLNNTTFKYRNREIKTFKSGSRSCPNFATGKVRDLSIAPDITGYTQTYRKNTTIDEKPLLELEEVYGFLVNSDDIGQPLISKWGIVSSTVTNHEYNNLGYYLGYKKVGYRNERYDIENPKSPKTLTDQNRKYYKWTKIPINEKYDIYLAPYYKYYVGNNTLEGIFIENDIAKTDESYIEPYFVIAETKYSVSVEIIDNPKKEGFKLTKGKETISVKQIHPFSPVFAPYNISPSTYSENELQELRDKEGYYTTESNFSSEGGQYNTSTTEDNSNFTKGQPSLAAGLPLLVSKSNSLDEEKSKPPLMSKFYKSIIAKNKNYKGDNRGKTLSYNEASTLEDVKQSVYTDWLINNIKNGITVEFTIQGLYDGYEGEAIILNADDILYKGVILSINYDITTDIESFQINNLNSKTIIKLGLLPKDKPEDIIEFKLIKNNSVQTAKIQYIGSDFSFTPEQLGRTRYSLD